jgi:hypothetical protein
MPPIHLYPTRSEYREALYNTNLCFKDPVLRGGAVTTDDLGLPKAISGAAASVFTIRTSTNQRWAVKCFTRFVDHQELRYQCISEALRPVKKPWRVEFDFLPEGVLCQGRWYPALKMEWVEAVGLIPFIEQHLWEPNSVADLAVKFARMVEDLADLRIAHGDLQHDNLLVTLADELKLIDYDGMYVPSLAKIGACENGHPNYQSPARTLNTWGPYIDNFSAWVIYASLVAVSIEPSLWTLLRNQGEEALLFKQNDFGNQAASRAFQVLSQSKVPDLQALSAGIKALWTPDLRSIPPLDPRALPAPTTRSAVTTSPRPTVTSSTTTTFSIPDWVTQVQATQLATPTPQGGGSTAWITGHLPSLPLVAFRPSRVAVRTLALLVVAAIASSGIVTRFDRVQSAWVGVSAGISLLLFIAVSIALFRRTPEWSQKRSKLRILKERRAEALGRSRDVVRIDNARRDIDGREQKDAARITKQAEKARSSEQKELASASKRLQTGIGNVEKRRQRLTKSETSESGAALRSLQSDHVARYLGSQLISSARIPGIGQGVAQSLAAYGIRSAADFTGIHYQTGPRGGRQVYLETRYGPVHPSGVGEKKARDLEGWRRSVEYQARASQPMALPPTQLQAIKMKYTQQRQALADEEQVARAQAAHEQKEISARWAPTHADLSGQLVLIHQKFAQERAQTDAQLAGTHKQADVAVWQRDLAEREVAAYQKVSYRQYLAGIVRS